MGKIIMVAGPESSGTRLFTNLLREHSQVTGYGNERTDDKSGHSDMFDDVWLGLHKRSGKIQFPTWDTKYAITRRSVPHSGQPGHAALYMTAPPLEDFHTVAKSNGHKILLFIPVRSFVPHISSWASSRMSCQKSIERALDQYKFAYSVIMKFAVIKDLQYQLVPMEALLHDPENFIQSLFRSLHLEEEKVRTELYDPNKKHYEQFRSGDKK